MVPYRTGPQKIVQQCPYGTVAYTLPGAVPYRIVPYLTHKNIEKVSKGDGEYFLNTYILKVNPMPATNMNKIYCQNIQLKLSFFLGTEYIGENIF